MYPRGSVKRSSCGEILLGAETPPLFSTTGNAFPQLLFLLIILIISSLCLDHESWIRRMTSKGYGSTLEERFATSLPEGCRFTIHHLSPPRPGGEARMDRPPYHATPLLCAPLSMLHHQTKNQRILTARAISSAYLLTRMDLNYKFSLLRCSSIPPNILPRSSCLRPILLGFYIY